MPGIWECCAETQKKVEQNNKGESQRNVNSFF